MGGGSAGLAAATAAARNGAEVMLVERFGYVGGLATGGLISLLLTMADGAGPQGVGGLRQAVVARVGGGSLAGVRSGRRLGPLSGRSVEPLCAGLGGVVARQTNRLSAALLRCAADGLFAKAWHDLAAALAAGRPADATAAADRLLGHGATSGADALAGFLTLWLQGRVDDIPRLWYNRPVPRKEPAIR